MSNFAVTLADIAKEMLEECGFDDKTVFEAMGPLISKNADNIVRKGTIEALTGPIERGDVQTVEKHMSVLSGEELLLYKSLARRTLRLAKEKNPERNYNNMMEVLE